MGLAQAKMTTEEARLAQLDAKARDNAQAILDMKSREAGMIRRVAKEQWIKTSFWMPENSEVELKQESTQAANLAVSESTEVKKSATTKIRMVCPHSKVEKETHNLRFKDLITIKLNEDLSSNEFICEICRKKLGH